MKELMKRICILLLAVCMAVGTGLMITACRDREKPDHTEHVDADNDGKCDVCGEAMPGDSKVEYTVTVTCEQELVLLTIEVQLLDEDGVVATSPLTGGTAKFTLAPGNYTVRLSGAVGNYDYEAVVLTARNPSATIALTPKQGGEVNPDADKANFTVKLTLGGVGLKGATIQVCGGPDGACHDATTDDQGVASFKLLPGDYQIHLVGGAPEGYTIDEEKNYTIGKEGTSVTVELQKNTEYTVTVTAGEAPAADVTVVFTSESGAETKVKTNAQGVATVTLLSGSYTLTFENLPEGFGVSGIYSVNGSNPSVTVELVAAVKFTVKVVHAVVTTNDWGWEVVSDGDPVAGATVSLYRHWYDEDGHEYTDEQPAAIGKTNAEGVAEIMAPSNVYVVKVTGFENENEYSYENVWLEESAPESTLHLRKLGTDLYHAIPVGEGTYDVSIEAGKGNTGVYYTFTPETGKSGYYEVTSSDTNGIEVDAYRYAGNAGFFNQTPEDSDEEVGDFKLRFVITAAECAEGSYNSWGFKFTAMTDNAVTFKVTFRWAEEYIEPTRVELTPDATEIDNTPISQPADTVWTWLNPSSLSQIVKEADGKYHFGAGGPVIYAAMGSNQTPQGFDASFGSGMAQAGTSGVTYSTGVPNDQNEIVYYNLTNFFDQYIAAADANGGLHILTDELRLALQKYAQQNGYSNWLGWEGTNGLYLFACGYYRSVYKTMSGEGTSENPFTLAEPGDYKTTVSANTTVHFLARNAGIISFETDGVTLQYNGATFTKGQSVELDGGIDARRGIPFTVTAEAETEFVFTYSAPLGTEQNPIAWQVGDNTVEISEEQIYDGVFCSITVSSTGVYSFTTNSQMAFLTSPIGLFDDLEGEGSFSLELIGGQTYVIVCGIALDANEIGNYTVTVAQVAPIVPTGSGADREHAMQLTENGWYRVQTNTTGDGYYFALNARTAGTWEITITNPIASVIAYGKEENSEGITYTLGEDGLSLTISTMVGDLDTGVFYFYMGVAEEGAAVYFFYFEKIEEQQPADGDLVVGENTITVTDVWNGTVKTFIAPEASTYAFSVTDPNANVACEVTPGITEMILDGSDNAMMSYTLTMSKGQSVTFTFFTNDYESGSYVLTIAKDAQGGTVQGDLIVGDNTITIGENVSFIGVSHTFVAPEAGTYVFSIKASEGGNVIVPGAYDSDTILDPSLNLLTYQITLTAGQSFEILCFMSDYGTAGTFTLTIAKA